MFDHHAVPGACDSPRCVEEPHRNPPQGHELPAPLGQSVIPGCGLLAQRTARANAAMRGDGDLDSPGMALAVEAEAHVLINKADKGLYSIQNGLKLQLNS